MPKKITNQVLNAEVVEEKIETETKAITEVKPKRIGRPPKYLSTETKELEKRIDKYFKECDEKEEPATITGLALTLGMDRDTLLRYENDDKENLKYSGVIKTAKERIRETIEKKLITAKTTPVGLIFWLKNNANWKDSQDINHTGQFLHAFIQLPPKKSSASAS